MENMEDFHESFVVRDLTRGKFAVRKLLLFNFRGSGMILEKERAHEDGGVAQLGEHLPCKQGVMGSIPIISTIFSKQRREAPLI